MSAAPHRRSVFERSKFLPASLVNCGAIVAAFSTPAPSTLSIQNETLPAVSPESAVNAALFANTSGQPAGSFSASR